MMDMLRPYCKAVPGTPMYIEQMRHNILAMVSNPLVRDYGVITWFNTLAPIDTHGPILYTQYIRSSRGISLNAAADAAMLLSLDERQIILRKYPALASRIFVLKNEAFFECIINGNAKPFGNVKDFFRRTEFQRGGSPHVHGMYSIDDGPAERALHGTADEQLHVKRIVDVTLTASLFPITGADVTTPQQHDHPTDVLPPTDDPRRLHFDPSLDYRYDTEDGTPRDARVRQLYKSLQLISNGGFFHTCTFTCWKYNKKGDKTCRFGFARNCNDVVVISEVTQTGRKRSRTRVEPVRNHGWLNPLHRSPLLALAHGANYDLQYCAETRGAAEYM